MSNRPSTIDIVIVDEDNFLDNIVFRFNVSDEEWSDFLATSLRAAFAFSHEVKTPCLGCMSSLWKEMFEQVVDSKDFELNTIRIAQIVLGIHMMHSGTMPKYENVGISLKDIVKYYAHEDGDEPEFDVDIPDLINRVLH